MRWAAAAETTSVWAFTDGNKVAPDDKTIWRVVGDGSVHVASPPRRRTESAKRQMQYLHIHTHTRTHTHTHTHTHM